MHLSSSLRVKQILTVEESPTPLLTSALCKCLSWPWGHAVTQSKPTKDMIIETFWLPPVLQGSLALTC